MSVREGQTPNSHPESRREACGLTDRQVSRLVNEIWQMSSRVGTALPRPIVRQRVRELAVQRLSAAEILHGARNAYGIVDPTGETAARNLDAAARRDRSRALCPDGCLTDEECKAHRPVPTGTQFCCGPYDIAEMKRGGGCPVHRIKRAPGQVVQ